MYCSSVIDFVGCWIGLHLLPNSICISGGSFFAGYVTYHLHFLSLPCHCHWRKCIWRFMMRRHARYKTLNAVFGILPFIAALLMTQMRVNSHWVHLWCTIVRLHITYHILSLNVTDFLDYRRQMPLGFGNAVVLQTMYSERPYSTFSMESWQLMPRSNTKVALVSSLPDSQMAVGTGFVQLLRGLGMFNYF